MNILVTGVSGFIGNRLAQQLNQKHHTFGLYHDNPPKTSTVHSLQGSITDYHRMLEILVNFEIDQIYHCAARSIVRNCRVDPLGCFQTNVQGTAVLLEAARQSERIQGIMCMESDKSYGSGTTPYKENQALNPTSIYEASKACVNHLTQTYHVSYGLPIFTIRAANVYGPRDPHQSRLVPNTLNRLREGKRPQINAGAQDYLREFIFIDDLVRIQIDLMVCKPWGEAINVGTEDTHTVRGVINQICKLMDKPLKTEEWERPSTFHEIPEQSLCLNKLHGFLPKLPKPLLLKEGLERTIAWHKNLT